MILQLLINKNTNQLDGWASGNITVSNPDCRIETVEITEEELKKTQDARYALTYDSENKKISIAMKPELAIQLQTREELKTKVKAGTATSQDVQKALELLL